MFIIMHILYFKYNIYKIYIRILYTYVESNIVCDHKNMIIYFI